MSTRPWLWKGTWDDIHRPGRACLIAPLFALVPPLALMLCRFVVIGSNQWETGQEWQTVLIGGLMTLAISYGVTIAAGLPWFLALSKVGWAGLIPVISGSVFPLFFILADTIAKGRSAAGTSMPLGGYLFFLICGLFPATAFWKIIRKPT